MSIVYKQVKPDVLITYVEGESVLLDMKTGTYFGLDEVGTFIWKQLEEKKSFDEIVRAMTELYNANEAIIRRDVEVFLNTLNDNGLLEG